MNSFKYSIAGFSLVEVIAIPTFAFLSEGASFIPSPIIATLCLSICSFLMYSVLSSGRQLNFTFLILTFFAICLAVFSLSPVSSVVLILRPFSLLIVFLLYIFAAVCFLSICTTSIRYGQSPRSPVPSRKADPQAGTALAGPLVFSFDRYGPGRV